MKQTLNIILLCLSINFTHAQPSFQWAKNFGGTEFDNCSGITVDQVGNVYSIGAFDNYTAGTYNDILITKSDPSGNLLWSKQMGGKDMDMGQSIAVDKAGAVYTTGYFKGTADFDPGNSKYELTSAGLTDIFISKLDASGNFVWAKSIGGAQNDRSFSLVTDASGNVYSTGQTYDSIDFDPGSGVTKLRTGGFILKLNSSGNFIWVKSLSGSAGNSLPLSISLDAAKNIYTTGSFVGTVDFDPGASKFDLTFTGSINTFISKLDSFGNFVWARSMGGTDVTNIEGYAVKADASGNVFSTGYYRGVADFDPGASTFNLTSNNSYDIYIVKLNSSGNFMWAKSIGSNDQDQGWTLDVDASGNVFTGGNFTGVADFDPGTSTKNLTAAGSYDAFILKLDATGNFVWVSQFGKTENNYVTTLKVVGNTIYAGGSFYGTVDFNPSAGVSNLSSTGQADMFILKLDECAVDVTTSLTGNTIKANQAGATYKWLDCNKGNAVIIGETKQTYTPKTNGKYAVTVTLGACSNTSACVDIKNLSLNPKILIKPLIAYPNPSNGDLYISSTVNCSGKIINASGEVVQYIKTNTHNGFSESITNLQNGIYFIVYENQGIVYNEKIIVIK